MYGWKLRTVDRSESVLTNPAPFRLINFDVTAISKTAQRIKKCLYGVINKF